MEEIKYCENCKFYSKHYYWYMKKLKYAHSGHCILHNGKCSLVTYKSSCDKWELTENTPKQQNENFKAILKRAAKQIEDIAAIIQTE